MSFSLSPVLGGEGSGVRGSSVVGQTFLSAVVLAGRNACPTIPLTSAPLPCTRGRGEKTGPPAAHSSHRLSDGRLYYSPDHCCQEFMWTIEQIFHYVAERDTTPATKLATRENHHGNRIHAPRILISIAYVAASTTALLAVLPFRCRGRAGPGRSPRSQSGYSEPAHEGLRHPMRPHDSPERTSACRSSARWRSRLMHCG